MADEIHERRLWQHGARNRRRGCNGQGEARRWITSVGLQGQRGEASNSLRRGEPEQQGAHVQGTNGGNDNNELDPSASTTVSSQYPGWWRDCAIAPKQVAHARMLEECGHDPELVWEVIECMKRYYRAVNYSPPRGFNRNTRIAELKRELRENLNAQMNDQPMPFPMPKAEFLAHRYCHPIGGINRRIATLLRRLGKPHLFHPPSDAVTQHENEIDANQSVLSKNTAGVSALEATQKATGLEANQKVFEGLPSDAAENAGRFAQREAVQKAVTSSTALATEPEVAVTKGSGVTVTKDMMLQVLKRVTEFGDKSQKELADVVRETQEMANETQRRMMSTAARLEKELEELKAWVAQIEVAHRANTTGSGSGPLPGHVAQVPQKPSIFGATGTKATPTSPGTTDDTETADSSFPDRRRRRRVTRRRDEDREGRPAKRFATRANVTDDADQAGNSSSRWQSLGAHVSATGRVVKEENELE